MARNSWKSTRDDLRAWVDESVKSLYANIEDLSLDSSPRRINDRSRDSTQRKHKNKIVEIEWSGKFQAQSFYVNVYRNESGHHLRQATRDFDLRSNWDIKTSKIIILVISEKHWNARSNDAKLKGIRVRLHFERTGTESTCGIAFQSQNVNRSMAKIKYSRWERFVNAFADFER